MTQETAHLSTVDIACQCGHVRGLLDRSPLQFANRVICYCDDCQAFAHALGRPDILDANGGTDIVQIPPAALTITQGVDRIVALRLTEKGLYRFYSSCCRTPLGNTIGPMIPFIGIPRQALEASGQDPNRLVGPVVGAVHGEYAIGGPPPYSRGVALRLLTRAVARVVFWRLSGRAWPHPYFNRTSRKPIYPVEVLPSERRRALRALCGPDVRDSNMH